MHVLACHSECSEESPAFQERVMLLTVFLPAEIPHFVRNDRGMGVELVRLCCEEHL